MADKEDLSMTEVVTEEEVRWMEGLVEILGKSTGGSGKPPRKPGKDPSEDPPPPKEKPKPKKQPQVITWAPPGPIAWGTQISATQRNATTSGDGALTYSVQVGDVLDVGTHTLRVDAAETDTFLAAHATVQLVVTKAPQTITWETPAGITWPTKLSETQLNATTSGDGELEYDPKLEAEVLPGTRTLKVTASETDRHLAAEKTVNIEVAKATPVITWEHPEPVDIGVELDETQLNATCTSDADLEYKPAKGTKTTKAGNLTLRVDSPETDTYNKAFKNVTLRVNKPKQTITWANPADIVYETKLSDTQLNATLTKGNGALTYDPPKHEVLDAGEHTLKVTAAGTKDWAETEKEVTIKVTKAVSVIEWKTPAPVAKNRKIDSALKAKVKKGGTTLTYTPGKGTYYSQSWVYVIEVKNNDDANYSPTRAFTRLLITDYRDESTGFKETMDGTAWIKPTTNPNKRVCRDWDQDKGGMKTQGQKLMKDLSQLTGPQIKTYMDKLVTKARDKTHQGGTYPNYIWKFPNGLQVRYKPRGDAHSSNPQFCIEGRSCGGFSEYQSDIAFKLTPDGVPTAKGPSPDDLWIGNNTNNVDDFIWGSTKATHLECRARESQTIEWTPEKLVYPAKVGDEQLNAVVTEGDGELEYLNLTRNELLDPGSHRVKVKAKATDGYLEKVLRVDLTVEKGEHDIEWDTPPSIKKDERINWTHLKAKSNTGGGKPWYTPGPRTRYSEAGTFDLQVKFAATDKYNETIKTVKLTVTED